jgi:hypothetical protein
MPQSKTRLSISLSRGSARFLRTFSAQEKEHVSTVIENLVVQLKLDKERERLNAEIAAHYDSLPDAFAEEQAAWGELGLTGLAEVFESEVDATAPPKAVHAQSR